MSIDISTPLITTIIPTYRRPTLLRRAVRSVLNQTIPTCQVCVYDNASEDETASVVAELAKEDSRVRYYCHAENIGLSRNFLFGMQRVETPFFSFLSDDDVLFPRFFDNALRGFDTCPEAIFSALVTLQVDDRGRISGAPILSWRPGVYRPPDGLIAMMRHYHPDWTSVVFRREIIQELGLLDEDVGAPMDVDYMARAAGRFPIVVSHELGGMFVTHSESVSYTPSFDTTWPGWPKMIRNISEDEKISASARDFATKILTERLKKRLFIANGFGSLARGHWDASPKAAAVLQNQFGSRFRAFLLRMATFACRHASPVHYLLLAVFHLRAGVRRFKSHELQKQYGECAKYLEIQIPRHSGYPTACL